MTNYEANAHEAQMKILRTLLLDTSVNFSTIASATGLTSDHASFHIKRLIDGGFITKIPKSYGEYQLTRKGKEYANRMDTEEAVIEKQAKLSVVLDIVNQDGKSLQQERRKHPYFGYWGRPTGKIRWGETILEAAARELFEEAGLTADLSILGFYHKLDYDDAGELLEDKYLCLVRGINPQGDLLTETDGQHNEWLSDTEYDFKDKKFGNLEDTQHLIDQGGHFIFENKFTYPKDAY